MEGSAVSRRLALALALCALVACSTPGKEPAVDSRYEILSEFKARVGEDNVALRVQSRLAEGSLSDEQLRKLSGFIADILRDSGAFDMVVELGSPADRAPGQVLLDVQITGFTAASEADRKAGRVSQLDGTIQVTGDDGGDLGSARIWARGYRLDLASETRPPDTVEQFGGTIVELMQSPAAGRGPGRPIARLVVEAARLLGGEGALGRMRREVL